VSNDAGEWAAVACHAASGASRAAAGASRAAAAVLLCWAVSNAAADGLLFLVTMLLLRVALALLLRWDVSNAADNGLLLLGMLLLGQSRCWKCKLRCCCAAAGLVWDVSNAAGEWDVL
jgi:hypothetical protein